MQPTSLPTPMPAKRNLEQMPAACQPIIIVPQKLCKPYNYTLQPSHEIFLMYIMIFKASIINKLYVLYNSIFTILYLTMYNTQYKCVHDKVKYMTLYIYKILLVIIYNMTHYKYNILS